MVLDVASFMEAERLYMLVRDTAVHGRPLTALVLPDVLVSGWALWPGGSGCHAWVAAARESRGEACMKAYGQGTAWVTWPGPTAFAQQHSDQ